MDEKKTAQLEDHFLAAVGSLSSALNIALGEGDKKLAGAIVRAQVAAGRAQQRLAAEEGAPVEELLTAALLTLEDMFRVARSRDNKPAMDRISRAVVLADEAARELGAELEE